MLTISPKSSELPGGGAANDFYIIQDEAKCRHNYASSEYAILDLVYIPAVITLMLGAS